MSGEIEVASDGSQIRLRNDENTYILRAENSQVCFFFESCLLLFLETFDFGVLRFFFSLFFLRESQSIGFERKKWYIVRLWHNVFVAVFGFQERQ